MCLLICYLAYYAFLSGPAHLIFMKLKKKYPYVMLKSCILGYIFCGMLLSIHFQQCSVQKKWKKIISLSSLGSLTRLRIQFFTFLLWKEFASLLTCLSLCLTLYISVILSLLYNNLSFAKLYWSIFSCPGVLIWIWEGFSLAGFISLKETC